MRLGLKRFPKLKFRIGPSLIKYSLAVARQNISTSGFWGRMPHLLLLVFAVKVLVATHYSVLAARNGYTRNAVV